MSFLPHGEELRRAVQWISDHSPCDVQVIEEASWRFDLSPLEEEFLLRHFLLAQDRRRVVEA